MLGRNSSLDLRPGSLLPALSVTPPISATNISAGRDICAPVPPPLSGSWGLGGHRVTVHSVLLASAPVQGHHQLCGQHAGAAPPAPRSSARRVRRRQGERDHTCFARLLPLPVPPNNPVIGPPGRTGPSRWAPPPARRGLDSRPQPRPGLRASPPVLASGSGLRARPAGDAPVPRDGGRTGPAAGPPAARRTGEQAWAWEGGQAAGPVAPASPAPLSREACHVQHSHGWADITLMRSAAPGTAWEAEGTGTQRPQAQPPY